MRQETDGFNSVQFIEGGNRGASAQKKQTKSKMGSAGRQWAADEGSAQEKQQRRETGTRKSGAETWSSPAGGTDTDELTKTRQIASYK
ncbi:hypothetical protein QQF64_030398 [Cirrhinus molitorella]|uniref:Uncharacterized protein n=1 Tax=Cirrhinus molitorella TaxID=172907 RepID=A0ABR3N372_9TELE